MRLIDADALMPNAEYKGKYDILTAYDVVAAPTIDAVPVVNGEWGITRHGSWDIMSCSACGQSLNCNDYGEYYKKEMRFCPFCGAKMDGRTVTQHESI